MSALTEFFEDARVFAKDRRAFDQNRSRSLSASRADLEAIQPVLRGEIPLVIGVDRAAHIEALIRFAAKERVRIVLRGGAEAWRHAEALAAADIAVLLDPMVYGAGSFAQREARADGATLLTKAGVEILFFSTHHSSHFARILPQLAGNAVRAGLPHKAAMRALTAAPAAVFGRADSGQVAPGMRANLVLWSGDPLELSSRPLRLWIGGVEQSLQSRQTQLRDRYLEANGVPENTGTSP
jgi:imidazolonepropionase-like amidohydrolase